MAPMPNPPMIVVASRMSSSIMPRRLCSVMSVKAFLDDLLKSKPYTATNTKPYMLKCFMNASKQIMQLPHITAKKLVETLRKELTMRITCRSHAKRTYMHSVKIKVTDCATGLPLAISRMTGM
eukprot:scaffold171718_cov39-Prasinocladus_malaysianus.AAC.1